ncbi:unnamed protein product [Camellia sinensis]
MNADKPGTNEVHMVANGNGNGPEPFDIFGLTFEGPQQEENHKKMVSNNVFNGILDGSQAAGINANPMFSLGPPVNYCAMGNFLTQQQFLSTMSNFQQVGNLQSQNTGVSHAAETKGVYSSPLPDIFNPNSPTRTPSSVMNSSKKEETKAFDFISGSFDGCSIPKRDLLLSSIVAYADQILMNEAPSKSSLYLMRPIGALEMSE